MRRESLISLSAGAGVEWLEPRFSRLAASGLQFVGLTGGNVVRTIK